MTGESAGLRRTSGKAIVLSVVLVALLTWSVVPATAQQTTSDQINEASVVVTPHDSGSVTLTVVTTYNLDNEGEQDAFSSIQTDSATLSTMQSRFDNRMEQLANSTSNSVSRDVSVTTTDITLETVANASVGIVRSSATFSNLAAVTDQGALKLTEPFANGFTTDQPLIVRVPEGYGVQSVTPEPDIAEADQLRWNGNTDFTGFEVVVAQTTQTTQTQTQTAEQTTTTGPGFGGLVAGIGVIGAAAVLLFRRNAS